MTKGDTKKASSPVKSVGKEDKTSSKEKSSYFRALLVNALQSAVLAAIGTYATELIKESNPIDTREIAVMVIINAAFITPVLMWFYGLLDTIQGGVLKKLLIDQLLFSPAITACIIALRLLLIGTPPNEIVPLVKSIVPTAMKSSWLFWIPQRYLTLTFVPPSYHALSTNLCALVWNVIFSMILTSK